MRWTDEREREEEEQLGLESSERAEEEAGVASVGAAVPTCRVD